MADSFMHALETDQQAYFEQLRATIKEYDTDVVEKVADVMSSKNGLVYSQEGVFKYALTRNKHHFSFHSMVMYANADIYQLTGDLLPHVEQQKGCINYKSIEHMPLQSFIELIQQSARKDFSPVIAHYQKKS
ncbi:hypothetical protein [Marinicella sp. W31]|uniref:hypothetical protein n=1 Tax=Marinicella sp. W31 TaxID=3023713 RepID=UPI003756E10A